MAAAQRAVQEAQGLCRLLIANISRLGDQNEIPRVDERSPHSCNNRINALALLQTARISNENQLVQNARYEMRLFAPKASDTANTTAVVVLKGQLVVAVYAG
ncbi:hypothetical protein AAMO2058_001008000 [Amorphochlora amoebiformis]